MATFLMSMFCATLSYAQQDQQAQKPKQTREQKAAAKQNREWKATANQQTPEQRAEKRIEKMKQSLNLTDEQTAKVRDAQKQWYDNTKQNRESSKANRDDMKAKREAYDSQLKTILTPEQYQKYQEQGKNMQKGQMKKWRKGSQGDFQKGNHKKSEVKDAPAK